MRQPPFRKHLTRGIRCEGRYLLRSLKREWKTLVKHIGRGVKREFGSLLAGRR